MAWSLITSEKTASKSLAGTGRTKYQCDCCLTAGEKQTRSSRNNLGSLLALSFLSSSYVGYVIIISFLYWFNSSKSSTVGKVIRNINRISHFILIYHHIPNVLSFSISKSLFSTLNVPAGNSSPFSLLLLKIINGKVYALKDKGK